MQNVAAQWFKIIVVVMIALAVGYFALDIIKRTVGKGNVVGSVAQAVENATQPS